MIPRLALILFLFLASGVSGYFLGTRSGEKRISGIKKEAIIYQDQKKKVDIQILASLPALSKKDEIRITDSQTKETFLKGLLSDPNNRQTYNKTLRMFNGTKNKEFLALWITLGNELNGSGEYGELLQGSLQKINENPEETLESIRRNISSLEKDDDHLRGMLNNLVNELEVEKSQKVEFFGSELNRPISLNKNGGLADGSVSLIHSMVLLKQNVSDVEEIKPFILESFDKNPNTKERMALRYRLLEYFPALENEI
jgi:hypothetical protein